MKKLKSTLPNMLLSLTSICVVSGAILAAVNNITAGPIAASKTAALETAIKAVTPEFNNKPTEEAYMAPTGNGDSLKIYPAKMDGQLVGAAVESFTNKGFSGEIRVIVGFDTEGKIKDYSVLQHSAQAVLSWMPLTELMPHSRKRTRQVALRLTQQRKEESKP